MDDLPEIWVILQQAIQRRKEEGSNQWQDGYPNPEVITHDIQHKQGYVLTEGETVIGYTAVLINDEPVTDFRIQLPIPLMYLKMADSPKKYWWILLENSLFCRIGKRNRPLQNRHFWLSKR